MILSLKHVYKTFGHRHIIQDISFDILQGEMVALTGPSGSGKSTLLNMIGLLESVDRGEIILHGEPLPPLNSKQATIIRRQYINYLFQSFALINESTVQENLLLGMHFMKDSKIKKEKMIHQVLEKLNITHLTHQAVNTLSGGEQQRVAIARAILKPGEFILADEPTGSLDETNAQQVFHLLETMRDEFEKTILVVTHDLNLAQSCDRQIQLTSSST